LNQNYIDYKNQKSPFISYKESDLKPYQKLEKMQKLPGLYEDSSSDIWLIEGLEYIDRLKGVRSAVVKAYNKQATATAFWLGMDALFGLTLCQSYQNAHFSYPYLSQITRLRIPCVYDSLNSKQACAVVLEKLPGEFLSGTRVNNDTVKQLSQFMADTHSHAVENIGLISSREHSANSRNQLEDWHARIKLTINKLANSLNDNFDSTSKKAGYIKESIEGVSNISLSKIVPLMMDLRWDQFAQENGVVKGIYDLDCFVFAPIELDFIILEYLLTTEQLTIFVEQYAKAMNDKAYIPDLTQVRNVYRVLLFLMNVLGEEDIEKWMAQPCFFNGNHG